MDWAKFAPVYGERDRGASPGVTGQEVDKSMRQDGVDGSNSVPASKKEGEDADGDNRDI